MTTIFFVRHAQPEHAWENDRTRPLTPEGKQDAKQVLAFFRERLQGKVIDSIYCSPYLRSRETIAETAEFFQKEIITDERLREREKGSNGNRHGMFEKRWADKDYHEEGGESIHMVQERNVAALMDILHDNKGKTVVIGTHGTALSSILQYFEPEFGCQDFLRIIDWMPYIIELEFEGERLVGKNEHLHVEKVFQGKEQADTACTGKESMGNINQACTEKKCLDNDNLIDTEKLLLTIDRKDYKPDGSRFQRVAARGIIRRNGKYAMIHSKKYGEYKFPGGGRKQGEALKDTLVREVQEETGLQVKRETIKYLGRAEELRKGMTDDICEMTSHYFFCEVEEHAGKQKLDEYEQEYGYELEFVSLQAAIENNEKIHDTVRIPWIDRDTAIMRKLAEEAL